MTLASSETRLPLDRLKEIFQLGLEASEILLGEMEGCLKERTRRLAESGKKMIGERIWDEEEDVEMR